MNTERKIERTYDYNNETGKLQYQVVRYNPKSFSQRRPDGNGGWIYNLDGTKRVLYNLPQLLDAPLDEPVYLCEGEKDVETLTGRNFIATTCAGGVNGWRPEFNEFLRNREVIIPPDNDAAGKKFSLEVAKDIYGTAKRVKILNLPGLPPKGDITDFFNGGGPEKVRELMALTDAAPVYKPEPSETVPLSRAIERYTYEHPILPAARQEAALARKEAKLVFFSDIVSRPVDFLIENRIPLGMLTILAGDPGLGKSYLSLYIASLVSRGARWPDGSTCRKGKVIILSAEDPSEYVIKPRLDLLEADSREIMTYEAVKHPNGEGGVELANFNIVHDLDLIEKTLNEYGDIKLVIIDPLSAYFGNTDTHKDAAVRSVLTPLVKMAERHGIALVCVMHLNKSNSGKAVYRTMGSLAFPAAARTVWLVCNNPADTQSKKWFLLPVKHNVLKDPTSMSFENIDGRLIFDDQPVTLTADDCLGAKAEEKATEKQRAIELLKKVLAGGEPVPSKQIEQLTAEAGISEITLKRAKRELGVKSGFDYDEEGKRYYFYSLPGICPKQLQTPEEISRRLNDLLTKRRNLFGPKPGISD